MQQQPGRAFEGETLVECLSLPLDLNLFNLTVKNCSQAQKGIYDIIEVLKKYPVDCIKYKLDIIENLPAGINNWNIGAVAIMLIKDLLDIRRDKKVLRNRIESLLIKQFEILVSLNNNVVICKRFAEVYAGGQISSYSYLKIIEQVLERRDKNDYLFLTDALKGLHKVLNDGNKYFAPVYKILKQTFLWPEDELKILALQNLSLIFKEHHDNKTFMKEFLVRFKNLYLSNGLAVVNKADENTFFRLCDFWKEINPQILNSTLQVVPPDLNGQLLSYQQ